jgi:hypothetical protein
MGSPFPRIVARTICYLLFAICYSEYPPGGAIFHIAHSRRIYLDMLVVPAFYMDALTYAGPES